MKIVRVCDMADILHQETFENAIIDARDRTITEYKEDGAMCYSLDELLKRWDGVVGIKLTIQRCIPLPPDGRDEY